MNASDGVHKTDYYVKWICRHQQLHQLSNIIILSFPPHMLNFSYRDHNEEYTTSFDIACQNDDDTIDFVNA